jgi:hypothetical protein
MAQDAELLRPMLIQLASHAANRAENASRFAIGKILSRASTVQRFKMTPRLLARPRHDHGAVSACCDSEHQ